MNRRSALVHILFSTLLCLLLLSGTLASAQDATTEPEAAATVEVPTGGVTTLVLLMGLGAVTLVGAGLIARNNFKQDSK